MEFFSGKKFLKVVIMNMLESGTTTPSTETLYIADGQ